MTLGPCTVDLAMSHPGHCARILEQLPSEQIHSILENLPAKVAAGPVAFLAPTLAAESLSVMQINNAAAIVGELALQVSVPLLNRLEPEKRRQILAALPSAISGSIRNALRYAQGSVGALVDPNVMSVNVNLSIREAITIASREPRSLKKYLYLTEAENLLVGVVDVRECLLAADGGVAIGSFSKAEVQALRARATIDQARADAGWMRFAIMPVTDHRGVFLGIVRSRDLMAATSEAASAAGSLGVISATFEVAGLLWNTSARLFVPRMRSAMEDGHERS